MSKISTDAYVLWQWKFYPNQKNQRYGQGFINHFHKQITEADPDLFYDTNVESCKKKIQERYIESDD